MEISKGKTVMHEINNIVQIDDREVNSKSRKCLLCGIARHYQKNVRVLLRNRGTKYDCSSYRVKR